jgi:hypothetical protein
VCGAVDDLIELPEGTEEVQDEEIRSHVSQLHMHGLGGGGGGEDAKPSAIEGAPLKEADAAESDAEEGQTRTGGDMADSMGGDTATATATENSADVHPPANSPTRSAPVARNPPPRAQAVAQQAPRPAGPVERDAIDDMIFYALLAIGSAICYLLLKKYRLSSAAGGEYGGHNDL